MISVDFAVFFIMLASYGCLVSDFSGLGYLFLNVSQPAYCYELSPNDDCPPNLVNYNIVGFNRATNSVARFEQQTVRVSLALLDFFNVSQFCRESVRLYSCSNNFAVCTTNSESGVSLTYDSYRTKVACESIQSNCPIAVSDGITFNCSLIQKDVIGYTYCVDLPEVLGDVCSKSSYKVCHIFAKMFLFKLEFSRKFQFPLSVFLIKSPFDITTLTVAI